MAKKDRPQIKGPDDQYEALRREGMSKEKAARIANASANQGRSTVARRGGKADDYEAWSKTELYEKAKQVGIEGRSKMDKRELISSLRNH